MSEVEMINLDNREISTSNFYSQKVNFFFAILKVKIL